MKANYLLLLKDLWLIICIAGNVYQVTQISELYFNYDVVTIVKIDFPRTFRLPSFTICLYTTDIVKWSEAMKIRPRLMEQFAADNISFNEIETVAKNWDHDTKVKYESILIDGWSTGDVFKITLNKEDLFYNCSYLSNETYLSDINPNCSLVFNIRPFFKECYKCFTFHSVNNTVYNYLTAVKAIGKNGFVSSIKIKDEIIMGRSEVAPVYYSGPETLPRSASSVIITPLNQTIQFTVDSYESTMLPAPYISNCFDYSSLGLEGDDHCYECCARNESVKIFNGSLFPGPCITKSSWSLPHNLMSIDSIIQEGNTSLTSKSQLILEIMERCKKDCSAQSCRTKIVIPWIMNTNDAEDNVFVNYVQQTPDILTTYIPTLDIIEYLTQISSTFGVWTGLSFFSLYELFLFLLRKTGCQRKKALTQAEKSTGSKTKLPATKSLGIEVVPDDGSNVPGYVNGNVESLIYPRMGNDWIPAEKYVYEIGTRGASFPCVECTIRELLKNNQEISTRNGMARSRMTRTRKLYPRGQFNQYTLK